MEGQNGTAHEPVFARMRDCACPGTPHAEEGDGCYLRPTVSLRGGMALEAELTAAVNELQTGSGAEQLAADVMARVRVWDLHGLHAAEAAALVEEALEGCRGDCAYVALLTGARNHSAALGRGGGSLHGGLQPHLAGLGWRTYEPRAGVLVVQV